MKLFLNQCFDKTRLRNLIAWVLFTKGEKETIEIVEKLKGLGFQFATRAGISLSIDDLKIPLEKVPLVSQAKQQVALATSEYEKGNVTTIEKLQQLVDTWHRTSETLKQTVVSNFQATDKLSPVYMMAFSGARGNISQVRQLAGMRGLMADPQGQIIGFPIRSNFREGLTLTEYMISCYGARKGLVDTALRTADAGYLTRRLVDVSQHMVVKASTCGTRRGIVLYDLPFSGKSALSLRDRLVGRVLAEDVCEGPCTASPLQKCIGERNQEISANLASQIASLKKKVSVRSPLTCSIRHGVCQLCYGWSLSEGRVVNLGEAVGIIAAQSIGEPGTQLTMRTFHTGGVFSGDVLTEIRAPYEGIAHFTNPLQGLLIRTSHGKIAFLTKASGELVIQGNGLSYAQVAVPPEETIFRLEASTVIFVRQHEKVSRTQLIAEFSSEINETIEAKRTLFANSAGQISFASSLIGGRLRGNGDIIQFSRDLGFVWILSGKESAPRTLLDLFQKGAHIVNQNTIIARVPTSNLNRSTTFFVKRGFDSRAAGRAPHLVFLPSILYSWIRLKNRESLSIGQPRPISDQSKSHLPETSRLAAKPIQKNGKGGFYKGSEAPFSLEHCTKYNLNQQPGGFYQPHVSYYPAQTNREDPVLGLGEISKNGISKNLFTLSHYITLPKTPKVKVKGHLFKEGDNTNEKLVWIFPCKYKTTRNGLAWFDSRYLNRELSLGELIWIETEPYTAPTKGLPRLSVGKKEEDQKQSSLAREKPSSMYSTRIQKCQLFLTFRNRAHPTNEISQSFSKEKGSNDHRGGFTKKKVQSRGFTNRRGFTNPLSPRKWGFIAGSNVVGEGRESNLFAKSNLPSLLPHSVMWQGKKVSGIREKSGSCWVYCPQEREKVSTLHESINFYRNRQFDKFTFDSWLVYIKGWFSSELVYSVKNNLVSKLSIFSETSNIVKGIGDASFFSLETRQSDWRLTVDLTSSPYIFMKNGKGFPVRRRAVNRQDNDGLINPLRLVNPPQLHFAGPTDDAPDDKKSLGLLFLRKWMQIPQRYARTVPKEGLELDSRTGYKLFIDTQNCFQAGRFDSRKNVSKRGAHTFFVKKCKEAVASPSPMAERYKFLVWRNLMNCKPFLLLRTCPLQVQVISNTKGRHFLHRGGSTNPLTWHHLVDSRGPSGKTPWQGTVQKGRKAVLHQLNLRQQIRLAPLSEKAGNFFDSLLEEGYQDVTAHKGISWPYSPEANLFTVISKGCSMPLPKVNCKSNDGADNGGTGFRNALQRGTTCQEGEGGFKAVRGEADSSRTSTFRFIAKVRSRLLVTDRKPTGGGLPLHCVQSSSATHFSLVSLLLANNFCTKLVSNNSYLLRFLGIPLASPKALTSYTLQGKQEFNVSNVKTPATGELVGIQGPKPSPPYLLTEGDQISMSLFEHKIKAFVGQFITLGEEFVPEYAATASGQVVAIEENKITFRRTQPFLFYAAGIIHVNHRQWVNKNAPILTLTYQKLVTGDIVQGIPKIEQFFEAPATREGEPLPNSLQSRLRKTYHRLRNSLPQIQAVKRSLEEIQQVLVEGILRVYLSQGVRIADKHLEIVIRQMTSKGQILDVGNTGLFRGEFVNLDRIERINLGTYGQKADYEPSVLGITQASLGAESFISAASFQETTRVLSRDTIVGKTDFLRGLKERVVLGDVIQAGTGLDDNINYGLLFRV